MHQGDNIRINDAHETYVQNCWLLQWSLLFLEYAIICPHIIAFRKWLITVINAGENLIAPPTHDMDGLASWCVAVGPRICEGSEETPPTRRIALPSKGEAERLGNRAETTRPFRLGHDACILRSALSVKR